jgi:hypothetical protein
MTIDNSKKLRNELSEMFYALKNNKVDTVTANAMANIAGKMIRSAVAQTKYYELRKESPSIEFLSE